MILKEHTKLVGFEKLVAIKASLNKGLSDELKAALPNIIPENRQEIGNVIAIDPEWIAGFVDAEGCFQAEVKKSQSVKTGYQVLLRFSIGQHNRDLALMQTLIQKFGCGYVIPKHSVPVVEYRVTKFSDILEIIIPFFEKYPLRSAKYEEYLDFCKIAEIVKNRAHSTQEGLQEIQKIKSNMNRRRLFTSS